MIEKKIKPPKPKTCKACKDKFIPAKPLQICCDFKCAIEYGNQQKIKKALKDASKQRIEHRQAKEKAKTRGQWMKEAQAACNAYVRFRDRDLPCISCDSMNRSSWDAGHYRTTAAAPEIRLDERNIFKQCVQCNQHQHGNLIEFRIGIIKREGVERVEWLEGKHEPKHYSIDDLKRIKAEYKAKLKALQAANPID